MKKKIVLVLMVSIGGLSAADLGLKGFASDATVRERVLTERKKMQLHRLGRNYTRNPAQIDAIYSQVVSLFDIKEASVAELEDIILALVLEKALNKDKHQGVTSDFYTKLLIRLRDLAVVNQLREKEIQEAHALVEQYMALLRLNLENKVPPLEEYSREGQKNSLELYDDVKAAYKKLGIETDFELARLERLREVVGNYKGALDAFDTIANPEVVGNRDVARAVLLPGYQAGKRLVDTGRLTADQLLDHLYLGLRWGTLNNTQKLILLTYLADDEERDETDRMFFALLKERFDRECAALGTKRTELTDRAQREANQGEFGLLEVIDGIAEQIQMCELHTAIMRSLEEESI